jgi:ribosomal protein S18 acetylase RimI-like enzyme
LFIVGTAVEEHEVNSDNLELIRQIETLAMGAWPAETVVILDGWRLRYTQGVTRRANSVWPNEQERRMPLSERLDAVEAFYAMHDLPARYQICPAALPVALDATLAARGYSDDAHTHVQINSIATLLDGAAGLPIHPSWTLTVAHEPHDTWFDAYQKAEAFDDHEAAMRRAIIARISGPCGFALLTADDTPVSLGLGVVEGGYLGIFSMATVPQQRRQGAATGVLQALARWAAQQGAQRAFLQVMQRNHGALALYAKTGFETLYDYHYRERS